MPRSMPSKRFSRGLLEKKPIGVLIIKRHWLQKILDGEKIWEIRGCATKKRGLVLLAQSRAGGSIIGQAHLVECRRLYKQDMIENMDKHCIQDLSLVQYKNPHAWIFQDAARYKQALKYDHPKGSVVWIKIDNVRQLPSDSSE